MSIARAIVTGAHLISRTICIWHQRAAAGDLMKLDDERLADIGLSRNDIHRAMSSDDPAAVMRAARDRNAGKQLRLP